MTASHSNAGIAARNFKMLHEIDGYADCVRVMEEHGKNDFAKIGPRMTLIQEGHFDGETAQSFAVELYFTKIIRYYPDGTFSVDSGGFNTPTTRERLNAVLPTRFGRNQGGNGATYFRDKKLYVGGLGPLDHSKRINIDTLEIISS